MGDFNLWDFLLVLNNNFSPILLCFRYIKAIVRQKPLFLHATSIRGKILGVAFGVDP